jgi:hypothetical protein
MTLFPKASPPGLSVNRGEPVPVYVTVLMPPSESTIFKLPVCIPTAAGVNDVAITQLAPPAMVEPHVEFPVDLTN